VPEHERDPQNVFVLMAHDAQLARTTMSVISYGYWFYLVIQSLLLLRKKEFRRGIDCIARFTCSI